MASSSGSSFSHSSVSSFVPIVSVPYCSALSTGMTYSSEKRDPILIPVSSHLQALSDNSSYSENNERGDSASCSTLTTLHSKRSESKLISTASNNNSSVEVAQSSKYCLSSATSNNLYGVIGQNSGHGPLGGTDITQEEGVTSIGKAQNYTTLKTGSVIEAVDMPKSLFDIHSVAHKKKLHYQREVLQQQQQQQKQMQEIHNKKPHSFDNQPLAASFSLFSHKKDYLPTVEDIQPSITIGSSYFPNLPLHHEQNLVSSPAMQQDSSRCSQGDSNNTTHNLIVENVSHHVEPNCKVDSLALESCKNLPENSLSSELINNIKLYPTTLRNDAPSVEMSSSLSRSLNSALTSNDPLNYCQAAFEAMEGHQLQNMYGNLLDKYSQGPANHLISAVMTNTDGFPNCLDFSLKQTKPLSNISDQDLHSLRTNDCSQSSSEKRNEGKHFTDISDLTVPKSVSFTGIVSGSSSGHTSSEHVYMQSHPSLEATTSDGLPLKNLHEFPTKSLFSDVQYHGESLRSEHQRSIENSRATSKSLPFGNAPAALNSRHSVQSLQHYNGDDTDQNEGQGQKPSAMVAEDLSKIEKIDQQDLLEPFLLSNNEESAPACSDNSFLGNVINCSPSDRENEDVLPNVDDLNICLNLAMPPYASQSLSTADKSSVNLPYPPQNPYYMNSQSCHSINTMFNSSFNQSSALSPAHSALNSAFYPSTNFEDFVQSNFPLYPNLPPFHPSNLTFPPPDIPVGPSAYSQSNKSLTSAGFLGGPTSPMSPANHPINLAPESSSAYDPQALTIPSHSLPAPIPISLALQPFHASQILNNHSFSGNHVPSCLSSNPIISQSHSIQSFSSSAFGSRSSPPLVPPSTSSLFLQPSGTVSSPALPPNSYCAGKIVQSQVSPSTPTHLLSNILSHSLPIITPPKFSQTPEMPKAVSQHGDSTSSPTMSEGLPSQISVAPSFSPSISNSAPSGEFSSKPQPAASVDRDNSCYPLLRVAKPTRTSIKLVKPQKIKASSQSKELFSCNKCSQEFRSLKQLSKHKLSSHEPRSLECNICKAAFKDRPSLQQHRQKQCCRRRYICRYCNRAFGGSSSLATHRRIHTGETPYQCTHCGKRFRQRVTLKSHLLVHTGERPFQCRVCSLRFSQRATLSKHFRSHMAEAKLKCGLCSSLLKDKEGLARHMKMLHLKCDYCDESFCNSKKRDSHVLKCHEDTRPFKCELCPSTFAVKLNYTKHKNSIHRKVDLVCDECGATFKRTDRFNAHKKIHAKDGSAKVHTCQLCSATFNQRNSLSKHYRAIHNVSPKKDALPSTTNEHTSAESAI